MGSDTNTGARQPHDWQVGWPIRAGPETTWESPEGREGAENQGPGWGWGGGSRACWPRSRIQSVSAPQVLTFPAHSNREQEMNVFSILGRRWAVPRRAGSQLSLGTYPGCPMMGAGINLREPITTTKPRGDPKVGFRGPGVTL